MEDFLSDKFTYDLDPITGERVVKAVGDESKILFQNDYSTYIGRDERLAPRPVLQKNLSKQSVFGWLFQPAKTLKKESGESQVVNKKNSLRQNFPFWSPRPKPPQQRPPQINSVVKLSREIYLKLNDLVKAYRMLQVMSSKDKEELRGLENQALIMRSTMFNIYRSLSGNSKPPFVDDKFQLDEQYCVAIEQTRKLVEELTKDILRLMQSIEVQKIDRQLLIINATLLTQERNLEKLRAKCVARED